MLRDAKLGKSRCGIQVYFGNVVRRPKGEVGVAYFVPLRQPSDDERIHRTSFQEVVEAYNILDTFAAGKGSIFHRENGVVSSCFGGLAAYAAGVRTPADVDSDKGVQLPC